MCDRCRCGVQAGVARCFPSVREALLFESIRALYCASLQCVWCQTRRREDELNCGRFFVLDNHANYLCEHYFRTVVGMTPAIYER